MIIDHDDFVYKDRWNAAGADRYNGAYYYAKEIKENIIPRIKTLRDWVLINTKGYAYDGAIVFIHNNKHPENYEWLKRYQDLVLVCGIPETCEKVKHLGRTILLPLSVDTEYVAQFKTEKTKEVAFAGRVSKIHDAENALPKGCDILGGLPREELLPELAKYKKVYAVGRTAIEARILGCEILPYDPRFPDPSIWQPLDNKEAAEILQKELNKIDVDKRKREA